MLALVSIITTAVNGCGSLEKSAISAGLPLSNTLKSFCVKSGTSRPFASKAVE